MVQLHVARRRDDGGWELLQVLRAQGRYMGGTWQVVAGGIEPNEKAWEAALRELREETSLVPVEFYHLNFIDSFYMPKGDTIWQCPWFGVIVASDAEVTLNEEHTDFRWVGQEDVEAKLMWPGQRGAFGAMCDEIFDDGPAKPLLRIDL